MKTCHLFIWTWEPRICYLHTDPRSPPLFKFSPIPALRNFSITDRTPSFSIYHLVSYWLSSLFIRVLCNHLLTIQALCNPFTCYLGTMQLSFLYILYNGYYATFYSLSINVNPSPLTRRTRCYHRQHLSFFLYLPIYLFLLLGSNCFQYTHVFNCSLVKYWSPWHQSVNFCAHAL